MNGAQPARGKAIRSVRFAANWTALLLLVLILFESVARVYVTRFASPDFTAKYAPPLLLRKISSPERPLMRNILHPYLGYIPAPNYVSGANRHNSLGFRGEEIALPKPPGEFRIACLGGSTTYCSGIEDYHLATAWRLQQKLRDKGYSVTVVNAGGEFYASYESLVNYAFRCSQLDLDLIVVYDGLNDMIARFVWPPSAYQGDNSGLRVAPGSSFDFAAVPWGLCLTYTLPKLLGAPLDVDPWGVLAPTARIEEWYQMKTEGKGTGVFQSVTLKEMLDANPPVFFERNLRHLVNMAYGDGVKVVLETVVHDKSFVNQPFVSADEIQQGYDEANAVIERVAAQTDSPLLDLASVFPIEAKHLVDDGIHFSPEGAEMHARLIAEFLTAHQLIHSSARTQEP